MLKKCFIDLINKELEKLDGGNAPFLVGTLGKMRADLLEKNYIEKELFDSDDIKAMFLDWIDKMTKRIESSLGPDSLEDTELKVLDLMKKDLQDKGYIEKRRWTEWPSEKEFQKG